jgi:hypothetical protein
MKRPTRLLTSFAGTGVLTAAPLVQLCEALERRGVEYHKAIPARIEVAQEEAFEDHFEEASWERRICFQWQEFHVEPLLSQDGLEGFRRKVGDLPRGVRGLKIRLGYALPGEEAGPVELAIFFLAGARWEVQLGFPAEPFMNPKKPSLGRAAALLVADLGEAMYDVLSPPYGALRFDAGVISGQLPESGWSYFCGDLVEQVGRDRVEGLARRCAKSWELADGGWFLAPSFLDSVDEILEEERRRLFAAIRHLTLEDMRGSGWKAN